MGSFHFLDFLIWDINEIRLPLPSVQAKVSKNIYTETEACWPNTIKKILFLMF